MILQGLISLKNSSTFNLNLVRSNLVIILVIKVKICQISELGQNFGSLMSKFVKISILLVKILGLGQILH